MISADQAAHLATIVVSLGTALQALEVLALRREFAPGGLYSWDVFRTFHRTTLRWPIHYVSDYVFAHQSYLAMVCVQLVASVLAAVQPMSAATKWSLGVVLTIKLLSHFRNPLAINGADRMTVIVLAGCASYHFISDAWAKQACLWFVGLQTILAYSSAGVFKWKSPAWRDGAVMANLLRTHTFGAAMAHEGLQRAPGIARAACWGTIVFEAFLPALVFVSPTACLLFLAVGALFHIGVAFTMGLNDFLWAFVATYPIVFRCSVQFEQWRQGLFA